MRSATFLSAAFAAGALAKPIVMERDYVTDIDVVTTYVTVTAGEPTPSATQVAVADVTTSSSSSSWAWAWTWTSSSEETSTAAPASTTEVVTTSAVPSTTETPTVVSTTEAPSSSAAASSTQAASSTVSAASSGNTYNDHVVTHHNLHRANHSASDVTWDDDLYTIALEIANKCVYAHDTTTGGGGYGQNIAAGAGQDNISSVITEQFYNQEMMNFEPYYGEATPSDMSSAVFDTYGHFTQIVWAGTESVACATVDCTGKGNGPNGLGNVASDVPPYFTVCNYKPAGNYLGEFNTNVAKPKGDAVAHWNYDE